MSSSSVDIDALKRELKAWERQFKEDNGRALSKDDVKAHPEIDAKYKLYRELTKKNAAKVEPLTVQASMRDPTTPKAARKSHASTKLKQPKLTFAKALPTTEELPTTSSNPFSPVKRRTAKSSPGTSKPVDDPFRIGSSSSTDDHLPNPFATSPSKSKAAGLAKARQDSAPIPSLFTSLAPEIRPTPSSASSTTVTSKPETIVASDSMYTYADSPKKLKDVIMSASAYLRDTPRTESRKRLRGEEVAVTPGDKRRKLVKELEDTQEDDEEEILPSPVKPAAAGPKGKVFQPLFDDSSTTPPKSAPLFFASSTRVPPTKPSTQNLVPVPAPSTKPQPPPPKRSSTTTSASERLSKVSERSKKPSRPDAPRKSTAPSVAKRSFSEASSSAEGYTTSEACSSAPEQITTIPGTIANPFGLRPPSPVLAAAGKSKTKNKWLDRKKGKTDQPAEDVTLEDAEDESDGEEIVVKDVGWTAWGELAAGPSKPRRSKPEANEDVDAPLDDPMDQYRTLATQAPVDDPSLDEADDVFHIDLPDDMKRLLQITSPSKQPQIQNTMRSLFKGGPPPDKLKGQEIYGVGDADDGEDSEGDWAEEPAGWAGGVEL